MGARVHGSSPGGDVCRQQDHPIDIPPEGITMDSGWTITPLVHPGVRQLALV